MRMRYMTWFGAGFVAALLSGCGTDLSSAAGSAQVAFAGGPSISEFNADLADDQFNIDRIAGNPATGQTGIAGTVWSSVPQTGLARFRGAGVGTIAATSDAPELVLRGDVDLTVHFGNDDISGTLRNITASDGSTGYFVNETVQFSQGAIGTDRRNDLTAGYAGDLTIGDTDVSLDGVATGKLRGTRFGVVQRSPVRALSLSDPNGTAMVDGQTRDFAFQIVGETN